jgi:hypothetical protein
VPAGQTRDNCGKQATTHEILKLVLTKLLTKTRNGSIAKFDCMARWGLLDEMRIL